VIAPLRAVFGTMTLAVLLVACNAGGVERRPGPYPEACSRYFLPARQCTAVVVRALEEAGIKRADVTAIDLLPVPQPEGVSLGGGTIALLGFHLADGSVVRHEVVCVGISGAFDPACGDDAKVEVAIGIDRDIPCDADGANCAKVPATPPPDLVARAKALRVPARDVVVDHPGPYEVKLGTARLPNGYLSAQTLTLVDDHPTAFWLDGARVEVRPDTDGRPPVGSIYREPFDGLEPVTVYFVFEVTRFAEPGIVQVRDIEVR